jgi:hypothetical protein
MNAATEAIKRDKEREEKLAMLELQEDMVSMSPHSGEDTKIMHNTCRDCADETKAQPQTREGALQVHQYLDREGALTYKNDSGLICFSNL